MPHTVALLLDIRFQPHANTGAITGTYLWVVNTELVSYDTKKLTLAIRPRESVVSDLSIRTISAVAFFVVAQYKSTIDKDTSCGS